MDEQNYSNLSYCRNFLSGQIILMDGNSEIGDKNLNYTKKQHRNL